MEELAGNDQIARARLPHGGHVIEEDKVAEAEAPVAGRFANALSAMSYDNPVHRPILDAEGLQRWLPPYLDGYSALRQAAAQQGFFRQVLAKSA